MTTSATLTTGPVPHRTDVGCVGARANLWPKKIAYPAFSAHMRPTLGGYVDAGSVLIVKADLARPILHARMFASGPFQRVVYRFAYGDAAMLQRLNEAVIRINTEFLGAKPAPPATAATAASGEGKPKTPASKRGEDAEAGPVSDVIYNMMQDGASLDMLDKALNSVELTPEQAADPSFDTISGVEVIDQHFRTFILEGPAAGAIRRLLEEIPRAQRNSKELKLLFNEEISFPARLYGAYHAAIKRIKLREPLRAVRPRPASFDRESPGETRRVYRSDKKWDWEVGEGATCLPASPARRG